MSLSEAIYTLDQQECEILPEYIDQPMGPSQIQQFPVTSDMHMLVTPSGLVAQACGNTAAIKKYGTIQMKNGIHIWEIIAIYDCRELQIGVSACGKGNNDKVYLQDFTASTIRTITVELNLVKYELHFYLNGNHNEKKTIKNLEKNVTYVPLINFRPQGKIAALNPFVQHPNNNFPQITILPKEIFSGEQNEQFPKLNFSTQIKEINAQNLEIDKLLIIKNYNHIYFSKNKMKLIRPQLGYKKPTSNQLINVFNNRPTQLNELIYISLNKQQFELLTNNFKWEKTITIKQVTFKLIEQFHYYWLNSIECQQQVYIQAPFFLLKQIVASQLDEYEKEFGEIFLPNSASKEPCKILQIVKTLLQIDEQLFALQLGNKQLNDLMKATQFARVAKIYSQYQRLHTFLDSNNYPLDIITLTQQGLLKLPGFANQFRHFSNYRNQIENFTTLDQLNEVLPTEKIYNCLDIPLEITINNIPYQQLPNQFDLIDRDSTSIYFSFLTNEGRIQIWNGELTLHKCLNYNLRSIEEKQDTENGNLVALFQEPQQDPHSQSLSQASGEVEEPIIPNEDLLNNLYNMGFSVEISKQALIDTNNQIEEAIEKAIVLTDQKIKEQKQPEPIQKQLKSFWSCQSCTFLNTSENLKCSMCEQLPPPEAFEEANPQSIQQEQIVESKQEVIVPQESEKEKLQNLFATATIKNIIQMDINQPFKQIVIAHILENNGQSHLIINRFVQSLKYLSNFFKITNDGFVSLLTNKHYTVTFNHQNLIQILNENENSRFIYQTLYPTLNQISDELELQDQIILNVEDIITSIQQQNENLIIIGKTQTFKCQLFQENVYKPIIEIFNYQQQIIETQQKESQAIIQIDNQQNTQEINDLTKLTSEEIQHLIKLNEHQQVYFNSCFNQQIIGQQVNDMWSNIIIEPNLFSHNQIKLELEKPTTLLKLQLTAYCDIDIQQSENCQQVLLDNLKTEQNDQLPLIIFTHKGSQFNVQQCISKICFIQSDIFSTVYSRPQFIFKHIHGKVMNISKFSVSSPQKQQNTGVPLGSGLIFIANNPNDFHLSQQFTYFNKEQYNEWKTKRNNDIRSLQSWEPVAYFEFAQNQDILNFELDSPKVGKYILLMTLSAKQIDQIKFDQNPLSLNYFIAYGTLVKETQFQQKLLQSQVAEKILQEIKVELDDQEIGQELKTYYDEKHCNQNKFICNYSGSQIKQIKNITISFSSDKIKFLQISAIKQKEISPKLVQKFPQIQQITNLMHDTSKYSEFNQKLMMLIHNPTTVLSQRISSIKVLCKLFQTIPSFIEICYKDLNILEFLKLNLISQRIQEESCVQAFLQYFKQIPNFNSQLINAIKEIIETLFNLSSVAKPSGLMQLLQILKQYASQNTTEYIPYLLSHLKQIIKLINNIDSTYYKKLNQIAIYSMISEVNLFSDKYSKLTNIQEDKTITSGLMQEVQKQFEQKFDQTNSENEIKTTILHVNPKSAIVSLLKYEHFPLYDEFNIDLLSHYNLNQFQLIFETSQLSCRALRITLENIETKQYILDVSFPDWVLMYITKYAETHKSALPKSKLNVLKWDLNLQNVRYCRLQITYSLNAATRTKEESTQAPKDIKIIPQFKGTLCDDQSFELKKQEQIKIVDTDFVQEFSFPHSLNYKMYTKEEVSYLDSAGILSLKERNIILTNQQENNKNSQLSINNIKLQYLRQSLNHKQQELKEKLQKGFTREKLNDLIQILTKLQHEIYIIDENNNIDFKTSLDFLYTYAYEILKICINIDGNQTTWRENSKLKGQDGLQMAQLIFNTFISNHQGPITEQAIIFLNVLLSNLNLKYWVLFSFTQYQKLDNNGLGALKQLNLPICQTLIYVHYILHQKKQLKQGSQLIQMIVEKLQQNKVLNEKELKNLNPIGIERSTSQHDSENEIEQLTNQSQELTILKVLETIFDIMNWALKNQDNQTIEDISQIFDWSCIIFSLLKNNDLLAFMTEISNIQEPIESGLFQLILNAIQSKDSNTILTKLKEFIQSCCNNETQKLIFYWFQNILGQIVRYANDSNIKIDIKNNQVWFNLLSFLVSQLIQIQSQMITDQKRKRSTKVDNKFKDTKEQITYQEFLEKLEDTGIISICSIETVQLLIVYMEQTQLNLNGSEPLKNSTTYWGIVMNLMSRITTQQLIETKLYEYLLTVYLNVDKQQQAILQFKFLDLTKQLLDQNQNIDFNSNLIQISLYEKDFYLGEGILTLLALKERKISPQIFKKLIFQTSIYLINNCNVGRQDGIYSCQLNLLRKVNLGLKMLQLVIKVDCVNKIQLIKETEECQEIIGYFIHWYMLNKSNQPHVTPATEVLNNISKHVKQIFEWIQSDEQLAILAVSSLYKFQKNLDNILNQYSNEVTNMLLFSIVKNTQDIFEELNELWMINDKVVREIAINEHGFEYLLERTHLTKQFEEQSDINETQPTEEEFGNKLIMLDQNGNKSQVQVKDWQTHKKGVKAKVHVLSLKDENSEEYILEFQLEKSIELKQLKLGFQTHTQEYNDRILGVPATVVVEVKNKVSDNIWYPIGIMTPIEDEAYTYYSVKVMALNFWRMNSSNDLKDQIKSISHQPISHLRLIMKKPLITFMEQISQLSFKQYNNIQIGISFLSVIGYDSQLNKVKQIQTIQEQTASRLLGKMCASQFRNTLLDISNNEKILNQIKKNFINVSQALQSNESTLSPLFVGLTKYNPEFGDWVLEQMLDIKLDWSHAKLTAEIVLQNKAKQLDRLSKFLQFILNQISKMNEILKQEKEFTQLTLLIEALTYTIQISSKQISQSDPIPLEIESKDFENILSAIQQTSKSYQQCNMIIKLFATLVKLPSPYVLGLQLQQTALTDMTQILLNSKERQYLKLLSILIQLSDQVVTLIIPQLQQIFDEATIALQNSSNLELQDYYFFLDSSANVNRIKDLYRERKYHIFAYEQLKIQNPTNSILKCIETQTLIHIVNFIGKITLSSNDSINQLANLLIKDIQLLSQIVDINYVENVLIPLLNFEERLDFTIDIWDKEGQMFVGDIRKLSSIHVQEEVIEGTTSAHELNGFSAKEFSPKYTEALQSAIQKVAKSNSLKKGGKWIKEVEIHQNGPHFNQILQALQKGPFLIILYGKDNASAENCIIGLFSSQKCGQLISEFSHDYYPGEVYPIFENGEQFGFTYEKDEVYHLLNNDRKTFGVGMEHENGGSFSFLLEKINLTFSEDQDISSVSIGIHDFDLLEPKPEEDIYFDDFWMQRLEIWIYQQPQLVNKNNQKSLNLGSVSQSLIEMSNTSTFGYGILSSPILYDKYFSKQSVYNYLSPTPIYNLPANCTASNILQCIRISTMSLNEQEIKNQVALKMKDTLIKQQQIKQPFIVLQLDGLELLKHLTLTNEIPLQYHAALKIFEAFQSQDGVKQIIFAAQEATKKWQNQELTQIWNSYVSELSAFCSVPQFFSYYLKNKKSMELLFQLLAGTPDQANADQKIWKEKEVEAVKFIYDTLSDVFKTYNNQEIRIIAIQDNLIQKILDKIAIVSKEKKREYKEQIEQEQEQQQQEKQEQVVERKPKKKQGVGYGSDQTGQNQKWNTQDYIDKKKIRSDQLKSLLEIIRNFFNYDNWHLNQEIANVINKMMFESALLCLLESAFRSGSLLEMSKDHELNLCYLNLTKTLAKHNNLIPLLQKIPINYVPRQIESIQQLLNNLKSIAQIFLSCLKTNELSEKDQISKQIALTILETDECVEEAIEMYDNGDEFEEAKESELLEILKLPLNESYRRLLKDLRFDYVSFKGVNQQYQHYYEKQINAASTPTPAKLIRLAQEFADMSNSLPVEHTNSIFVRADKDRVDVVKALVMGASGTPYAHGAYLFDIYFEDQYPSTPPKMNLSTTGGGKIRFNPNLYACGKVCLSLLGTWRGHASENWDPKLSTMLQVLVSTQAIIMSEDVYFNEPGFEGEAGQADGEMKNEAYSNIVRYGNIQYAMIENIKNPPVGFETIIRRHFYLKKNEIMEEVKKWIEFAENRQALYMGLVSDHNNSWCAQFKKSKTSYLDMLKEATVELEKTLNGLNQPTIKEIQNKQINKKKRKQDQIQSNTQGILNIDEVDVGYDQQIKENKILDITDEQVRDRWSRYIGAMGIDAVKKQSTSKVLLSGLGSLGVEIAKNVVLSGVSVFALYDNKIISQQDLVGQFFLNQNDLGKLRASACIDKIQQLNNYVRVKLIEVDVQQYIVNEKFDVVILTDVYNYNELICWNNLCREHNIKFIVANVDAIYGRIINDFGNEFTILDKNGEEYQDVLIKNISNDGIVELLDGQKAQYEDGDHIILTKVEGMELNGKSINNQIFKIQTINQKKFKIIDDISQYSQYQSNGIAKHIKQSITIQNKPFDQILNSDDQFDSNLQFSDSIKLNEQKLLHLAYRIASYLEGDLTNFMNQIQKFDKSNLLVNAGNQLKYYEYYLRIFEKTFKLPAFPPLVAYIGGFVSQEVIKAITNKFTPINQIYYTDCIEVLPYPIWDSKEDANNQLETLNQITIQGEHPLEQLLGNQLYEQIQQVKLFMVGCGAIGCELLKNFAMINIGIKGNITITDPDHIETSNLNRQFLFREKHIHKPKSQTAAAAVIQMNPLLKNKIQARMDKVYEQTENIFTDQFFEELTLVANALDNIQARRYVDRRCVKAKIPLLESGTLGPKGHVQCIIPFSTESYNSMQDPAEEGDIPYCTLKMFPEETFHCVEFARDKFSKLFALKSKLAQNMLDNEKYLPISPEEISQLKSTIKLLSNAPKTYQDCIQWARNKYEKYFVNDIKQLLYTYPPDTKTKDGQPFWRLPKRPPHEIQYDSSNEIVMQFISTLAYLRAFQFNLQTPQNWRQKEQRIETANLASQIKPKEWIANDIKKKEIEQQVLKLDKKQDQEQEQEQEENLIKDDIPTLLNKLNEFRLQKLKLISNDFEKDQDTNGHIDFIHAFGNLRAFNYGLDEMDWITVKLKAGRIVPALATTTAVVAGLQTIELVKILKKIKLEYMKNGFVNLAVPIVQLTEPMKAETIKINETISVTLWDRWDVKLNKQATLLQLFDHLRQTYQLEPVHVFFQSSVVYMHDLHKHLKILDKTLIELLELKDESYVDLVINFIKDEQILKNIPEIRVQFI